MESTGFIDILILAMIAAFLVFRLRSALGRRTGHQRRPDSVPREVEKSGDTVIHLPDRETTGRAPQDADDGPPPLDPADAEAMPDSEAGTVQLKAADPDFDEAQFLDGARIAFEMILDAYAGGDKEALRALLADDVLARFAREIDRRGDNDETLETTLVSFASVSVDDTRVEEGRAAVTVEFVTEQINVVRGSGGEIVDGDERKVARIVDIWTFERDLRSRDPNWRLVETRSGE